jgi:superfamily II DNA/RNA helicase
LCGFATAEEYQLTPKTFAELGLSEPVVKTLSKRGITTPFAIQTLVIADVLGGHDVLAQAPTGSGKTLAFGLPMIDRLAPSRPGAPGALVLVPTRELAAQVTADLADAAAARGFKIVSVYGGVPIPRQADQARTAHIVVACPGRLEDLIQRKVLRLDGVQTLVLDEADRMLDMGFAPAVRRLINQTPATRQTLFFSATLDGEVGRVARAATSSPREHVAAERPGSSEAVIGHRFVAVSREAKLEALVTELAGDRDLALVFARTKRGANQLVEKLAKRNVTALALHGNKSQNARERALRDFESGVVSTLVATDVAARGLDIDRITHVINFDGCDDVATYTHRTGRTGRAGRAGTAITLVEHEQRGDVARIAKALSLEEEWAQAGFHNVAPSRPREPGRQQGGRPQGGGRGGAGGASGPKTVYRGSGRSGRRTP